MESSRLTLALMAGLPGTGKTTLANALCDDQGWFLVDKDAYMEAILKFQPDYEGARKQAYDEAFNEASNKLNEGISVILDSALLDNTTLDRANRIVRDCKNVQLKIILCIIVDSKVREERVKEREAHVQNRPPRRYTFTVDPTTRDEYLHYFEHLFVEDPLKLDTSKSIGECLKEAKEYILVERVMV